ncbi:hypothetical protein RCL1_008559 [Eukaryota sp. TZLM3-RCL]
METFSKKKVVVVGDAAVGKTSLIQRFIRHTFETHYSGTIGVDFMTKTVYFEDREPVALTIWDTAGQERFQALVPSYLRECSAVIIVFDVTDRVTFDNAKTKWLQSIRHEALHYDDCLIFMVANKVDLNSQRIVTQTELNSYSSSSGIPVMETSARVGFNVKELFTQVALKLSSPVKNELKTIDISQSKTVNLAQPLSTDSSGKGCRC